MSDDEGQDLRAEWLREPPGAGEVRIMVDLGEGAELTPEAQAALERLMNELSDAEVSGYMLNQGGFNFGLFGGMVLQSSCQKLICNQHDCEKLSCDTYKSAN